MPLIKPEAISDGVDLRTKGNLLLAVAPHRAVALNLLEPVARGMQRMLRQSVLGTG
jgi:hypothetical protein